MSVTTNTTNPVFAAEQESKMNTLKWQLGENGSPELSEYGLCSKSGTPEYVGALCALSNKLLRGNSSKKPVKKASGHHSDGNNSIGNLENIQRLFENVMAAKLADNRLAGVDARAISSQVGEDLIIMMFNLRDIRGTYGRGERTLSYWMFMFLFKLRPKPMSVFLREFPNYGGWMDINNMYEMTFDNKWITYLTMDKITKLRNQLALMYATQLAKDLITLRSKNDKQISLAAKWSPKEGRALDKKTKMGKHIARLMYPDLWNSDFKTALKHYRRDISQLGSHLDVVERKMSSVHHEWSKINFDKVPGRALAKRTKAWSNTTKKGQLRSSQPDRVNCAENYKKYLSSLSNKGKTAKGKVMFVHELSLKLVELQQLQNCTTSNSNIRDDIILYESMMDAHLNSIVDEISKNGNNNLGNTAVMADVSGSMSGDPMAVSYAMAVIASHPKIASPAWANIVMTFSATPEWIRLQYPETFDEWKATKYDILLDKSWCPEEAGRQLSWSEKLYVVSKMPWGANTDFISALNLVATRAIEAGVKMPNLLCISDMQWDSATRHHSYSYGPSNISCPLTYGPLYGFSCPYAKAMNSPTTLLRQVKHRLASEPCGNKFTTILWNVRGGTTGYPCASDEDNFIEVAGFSTNMLKVFLNEGILEAPKSDSDSGTTWTTLRAMLDHEDYDRIRELTNLMKPWRNIDMRPLSMAEMSLLPDMTMPSEWSNQYSSSKLKGPILSPNLPKEYHPPKLKRSVAFGNEVDGSYSNPTYSVVDYSSNTMTCSYAEACSSHTPDAALKAPPPPPSPEERDVREDPMTRLSNRLDELEKQLLQVTAERDSLRNTQNKSSGDSGSEIAELKDMMQKLLQKST